MLASEDWRRRAKADFSPEQFQVQAYRELFQALCDAPESAPTGSIAAALSERARDVLQRLLEQTDRSRSDDFSFDEEYAGVLDGFHAREVERSLPPLEEVVARRQQISQLSPQEQKKRDFRKAAKQPRRPAPERPGPDHSPHP
jgi:hypothetical protein